MNTIYFGDKFLGFRYAWIPATAWIYPVTTPATPLNVQLTNGEVDVVAFSDSLGTKVVQQILIPGDLDTGGTAGLIPTGYSATGAASKNIEFTLSHSAKANGEAIDAAHTDLISGDLSVDPTTKDLDVFDTEWAPTVSTLSWVGLDLVRLKFGRTAPTTNDLVGDYYHIGLLIKLPVLP